MTPNKKSNFKVGYNFIIAQKATCIANGVCYWIINHTNNYTWLVIDLNGPKPPNIAGHDVFLFDIASKYIPGKGRQYIDTLKPFTTDIDEYCNNTSTDLYNGKTCASKIIHDGWKIKDDYPW